MANAFDDLVPAQPTAPKGNAFDDLPAQPTAPQGNAFDDLVPTKMAGVAGAFDKLTPKASEPKQESAWKTPMAGMVQPIADKQRVLISKDNKTHEPAVWDAYSQTFRQEVLPASDEHPPIYNSFTADQVKQYAPLGSWDEAFGTATKRSIIPTAAGVAAGKLVTTALSRVPGLVGELMTRESVPGMLAQAGAFTVGSLGGSAAVEPLNEKLFGKLTPEQQLNAEQHPFANWAGGMAPSVAAFHPNLDTSIGQRLMNAGMMEGIGLGTDLATGNKITAGGAAGHAAGGFLLGRPNKIGRIIEAPGAIIGNIGKSPTVINPGFNTTTGEIPVQETPPAAAEQNVPPTETPPVDFGVKDPVVTPSTVAPIVPEPAVATPAAAQPEHAPAYDDNAALGEKLAWHAQYGKTHFLDGNPKPAYLVEGTPENAAYKAKDAADKAAAQAEQPAQVAQPASAEQPVAEQPAQVEQSAPTEPTPAEPIAAQTQPTQELPKSVQMLDAEAAANAANRQKPRIVVPALARPAVDVAPVVEPTPAPTPTAEAKPSPVEAKPATPDVDPVTGKKLPQGVIEARKTADALIAAGLGDSAAAKNAVAQVNRWEDQNGRPKSYQTKQGELGQQPIVTPTERPTPAAEPIKRSKAIQDAIDQADKLEKSLAGATEKDRPRIERQLKLRRDQVNADDVRNGRKPTYGEAKQPALPVQPETPVAAEAKPAKPAVKPATQGEIPGTADAFNLAGEKVNAPEEPPVARVDTATGELPGATESNPAVEAKKPKQPKEDRNAPPPEGEPVKVEKAKSTPIEGEPVEVTEARRSLKWKGLDPEKRKEYRRMVDQFDNDQLLAKEDPEVDLREVSDEALDKKLNELGDKHTEGKDMTKQEMEMLNKVYAEQELRNDEHANGREHDGGSYRNTLRHVVLGLRDNGGGIPFVHPRYAEMLYKKFGKRISILGGEIDSLRETPSLSMGGRYKRGIFQEIKVDPKRLFDSEYRKQLQQKADSMLHDIGQAMAEAGYAEFDPANGGSMEVAGLLERGVEDITATAGDGEKTHISGDEYARRYNPENTFKTPEEAIPTAVEKAVTEAKNAVLPESDPDQRNYVEAWADEKLKEIRNSTLDVTKLLDPFVNESNQSELFGPKQVEFKLDANGNVESVKPAVNADAKPTEVQQTRKRKTIQQGEEIAANQAEPAKGDKPAVDRIHRIDLPGGKFGAVVEHAEAGSLQSGLDTVQTPADVAHVVGEWFAQRPQEVVAIVTADKNGKILSITRITTGTHTSAMFPMGIVAGAALGTPGATNVWAVHNHPSGKVELSGADLRTNDGAANILKKSGINYEGLFAIAKNKYSFVDTKGNLTEGADIPQIARNKTIPITERAFTQNDTIGPRINKPSAAIPFVKSIFGDKTGILLLNNLLDPVGSIEMTPDKMEKLRQKGGLDTLLPAIERANAINMIAYVGDGMDVSQRKSIAENLQKLSSASSNLNTVDMIGDNQSYSSEIPQTSAFNSNIHETAKGGNNADTNKQTKIEAWADAKLKESQTRFNTGLDPEIAVALAIKGVAHAGRAAGDFVKWSKAMVDEFGNAVKPHLEAAWEKLKDLPGLQSEAYAHQLARDEAGKPALDVHAAIAEEALKQDAAKEVIAAAASDKTPTVSIYQKAINAGPVAFFRAVAARMRSLKDINTQSPAMKEAVELFVGTPGKGEERDFLTAHSNQVKAFANRIELAMSPLKDVIRGMTTEAQDNLQKQMIKAIESGAEVKGHLGAAIKEIKAVMADQLAYSNEAGVKTGEAKDYFHRKVNASLVIADTAGFVAGAEKAYEERWRREQAAEAAKLGLPAPEPTSKDKLDFRNQAIAWKDAIVLNKEGWNFEKGIFENTKPGKEENFQKEREFTKEEAKHFEDFRDTNIWKILASQNHTIVKRAELTRRLGADGEKYAALKQRMKDEGVSPEHVNSYEEYVKNMIGYTPPKDIGPLGQETSQVIMNVSSLLTTLKFLAKTPILVTTEPAGIAHHTGNTFSAPLIIGRNLVRIANILRRATPDSVAKANSMIEQEYGPGHDVASIFALKMGITAAHGPFMEGAAGYMPEEISGNTASKWRGIMNRVHAGMGLDVAEIAKRESGVNEGMGYMQKLVDHATGNETFTNILKKSGISSEGGMFDTAKYGTEKLKGLGVPEAEHAKFAEFVNGLKEMTPDQRVEAMFDKTNPMAKRYRNAVELFTKAAVVQTTTGSRTVTANESYLGRALFMLNTYGNEYALQHKEALYNEALRLTNKDGGNTSAGERLMAFKHLAALPMTVATMYGVGQIYKAMNGEIDDKGKKAMFGLPHWVEDGISALFRTGITNSGVDMAWKAVERGEPPLPVLFGPAKDVAKEAFMESRNPGSNATNKAVAKTVFSTAVAPAINLGLTQATAKLPLPLKPFTFAAQQVLANPQTAKAVGETAGGGGSDQPQSAQVSKGHSKKK